MKRIWSVKAVLLLLLAICIIAGPSIISYRGLKYRSDYTQLLDEGSHTWGAVIDKGKSYNGWDVTGYTVTYQFSVIIPEQGSLTTTSTSEVLNSSWKQMQAGSQIQIIYNPSDPNRNFPVVTDVPGLWLQIIPGIICVSIGIWILIVWINLVREKTNSLSD
jgi:hypothetical protein